MFFTPIYVFRTDLRIFFAYIYICFRTDLRMFFSPIYCFRTDLRVCFSAIYGFRTDLGFFPLYIVSRLISCFSPYIYIVLGLILLFSLYIVSGLTSGFFSSMYCFKIDLRIFAPYILFQD